MNIVDRLRLEFIETFVNSDSPFGFAPNENRCNPVLSFRVHIEDEREDGTFLPLWPTPYVVTIGLTTQSSEYYYTDVCNTDTSEHEMVSGNTKLEMAVQQGMLSVAGRIQLNDQLASLEV